MEGGTSMLATTILVSWNRKEELRSCLESLLRQEGIEFEIIVVDNGSTDGTREMLREFGERIRRIEVSRNLGSSRARNLAIAESQSRFVFFVDSDATLMDSGALRGMVDFLLLHPSISAVGAPVYFDGALTKLWFLGVYLNENLYVNWERSWGGAGDPDSLSTCCALVRREVVEQAGGFDPFFFYDVEDVDFFLGLRAKGHRFAILPRYPVVHLYSPNGRKSGFRFARHFRHEWRHQYLFLKRKGFKEFVRFIGRIWKSQESVERYYGYRMNFFEKSFLYGFMPLTILSLFPLAVSRREKNFLLTAREPCGAVAPAVASQPAIKSV